MRFPGEWSHSSPQSAFEFLQQQEPVCHGKMLSLLLASQSHFFLLESVHKVIILLEIHRLPSRACSLSTHLSLNHLRTDSRIL